MNFLEGSEENIIGKGENAGYQHLLFLQCFQKLSFLGLLKVGIVWYFGLNIDIVDKLLPPKATVIATFASIAHIYSGWVNDVF